MPMRGPNGRFARQGAAPAEPETPAAAIANTAPGNLQTPAIIDDLGQVILWPPVLLRLTLPNAVLAIDAARWREVLRDGRAAGWTPSGARLQSPAGPSSTARHTGQQSVADHVQGESRHRLSRYLVRGHRIAKADAHELGAALRRAAAELVSPPSAVAAFLADATADVDLR